MRRNANLSNCYLKINAILNSKENTLENITNLTNLKVF